MNEKRLAKYLEDKGVGRFQSWNVEKLKEVLKDVNFSGESTGGLKFCTTEEGTRYIQFTPRRFYLE